MKNKELVRAINKMYPQIDIGYVKAIYEDVMELGNDWDYSDIKQAHRKIFGE